MSGTQSRIQQDSTELKLLLDYARIVVTYEYSDPVLGEAAVKVLRTLLEKGEALSDEGLASATGLNVIDVRKILHVLRRIGLVEFQRETYDEYRFTHKWLLTKEYLVEFMKRRVALVIDKLERRLTVLSTTALYVCPTCYRGYTMDEAYELEFKCPLDDTELIQVDSTAEVSFLTKVIKTLREGFGIKPREGQGE